MIPVYQNKDFLFIFKPHGIPSTLGKNESFLQKLTDLDKISISWQDLSNFNFIQKYFKYTNLIACQDPVMVIQNQLSIFDIDQEYWLLNRLDNDTSGFLYFAPDIQFYNKYKSIQSSNKIEKFYIAKVCGQPSMINQNQFYLISYPIVHHKNKIDRMVCIKSDKDKLKGRSKEHIVQTSCLLLDYNPQTDTSTLLIKINKWIRHQIRVHLASIGHPIIWDPIYWFQTDNISPNQQILQLFSIWAQIV